MTMKNFLKKMKKKHYWTKTQDELIQKYHQTHDEKIFNEVYPTLDHLIENVVNTYRFNTTPSELEEIKAEIISKIIIRLHSEKPIDYNKCYSYFSAIARFHVMDQHTLANKGQNKINTNTELSDNIINYDSPDEDYIESIQNNQELIIKELNNRLENIKIVAQMAY